MLQSGRIQRAGGADFLWANTLGGWKYGNKREKRAKKGKIGKIEKNWQNREKLAKYENREKLAK